MLTRYPKTNSSITLDEKPGLEREFVKKITRSSVAFVDNMVRIAEVNRGGVNDARGYPARRPS